MDKGIPTDQKADAGNLSPERTDNTPSRNGKPGRRPQQNGSQPDPAELQLDILRHFFPGFLQWLKRVRDPRKNPEKCTYPIEYILMTVLMMHCGQCGSRRQLGRELTGKRFGGNIWRLIGKAYSDIVCHPDTMNNVMEVLEPEEVEKLIAAITCKLRKSRALDRFRFDGTLVVAIDATGILSFGKKHCDNCTHRTSASGVTTYFHNVLAAKIVTPIGLVVPFAFEFIENPEGEYNKQDCEIKAARRLFEKIHKFYPRLKITVVGDGLYADEKTFISCDDLRWNYIITLKEDKLPTVTRQIGKTNKRWTGSETIIAGEKGKAISRTVRWMTPLRYHGDIVHVIEMEDTTLEGERLYYNRWITNVKPNKQNAIDLAQTGRLRWKIENEGINTQKTGGYKMEHAYGLKGNSWKNYYLFLQISQLINDMVRFSDYISKVTGNTKSSFLTVFGTIRNFARKLIESLRNKLPRTKPPPVNNIQIRLRPLII